MDKNDFISLQYNLHRYQQLSEEEVKGILDSITQYDY